MEKPYFPVILTLLNINYYKFALSRLSYRFI